MLAQLQVVAKTVRFISGVVVVSNLAVSTRLEGFRGTMEFLYYE